MVIFRRIRGPVGGVVSGEKGPVIPFLLRDKEVGGVKVNTGFIKIIVSLNKVKEKVKVFREVVRVFAWSL